MAKTRIPLVTDDALLKVGRVVRKLSGFLGPILCDELDPSEEPDPITLNTRDEAALMSLVKAEMAKHDGHWEFYKRQGIHVDERKFADLGLVNRANNKWLQFGCDEHSLTLRSGEYYMNNSLSMQWDEGKLTGPPLAQELYPVCRSLFDNDLFDYGRCEISEEFDSKNMDTTHGGSAAVGVDASALPGFYWGNYFGRFLCDLVGKEKLLAIPGCCAVELGAGVFFHHQLPPDAWDTPAYIAITNIAMDHIGRDLFFEKGKKRRKQPLFEL